MGVTGDETYNIIYYSYSPLLLHTGTLPTTITVYQSTPDQSSETPESAKTSTSPGVLIGVVAGMVAFSIALLLLVPLSIAVIAALYARKLRKVRDRRRAVVITQYGLESTEMLEVIHDERNGCGNMMVRIFFINDRTFEQPQHDDTIIIPSSATVIYSNSLMILCMPLLKTPSPSH